MRAFTRNAKGAFTEKENPQNESLAGIDTELPCTLEDATVSLSDKAPKQSFLLFLGNALAFHMLTLQSDQLVITRKKVHKREMEAIQKQVK